MMFYNCTKLASVDVSHFNTAKGLHGDVNGDGSVDVGDVTMLIRAILDSNHVNPDFEDVNGDGFIDVGDVTALISLVLQN